MTQDLARSLTRAVQNNFFDSAKQNIIDTFLYSMSRHYGEQLAETVRALMSQAFLRLPQPVLREMIAAKDQYAERTRARVCIGTYNINGGFTRTDMAQLDLDEWLVTGPAEARRTGLGFLDPSIVQVGGDDEPIDIFAVGFEEIVDLSAQVNLKHGFFFSFFNCFPKETDLLNFENIYNFLPKF